VHFYLILAEAASSQRLGISRTANPCRRGSEAWDVWDTGWENAMRNAEAAKPRDKNAAPADSASEIGGERDTIKKGLLAWAAIPFRIASKGD
jgi:hypothetical protein